MKKNILKYIILPCVSMALVFPLFSFDVFGASPVYWSSVSDCVNYYINETPAYTSFSDGGSSVYGNRFSRGSTNYYAWISDNLSLKSGLTNNNACTNTFNSDFSKDYFFDTQLSYRFSSSSNFGSDSYLSLYNLGTTTSTDSGGDVSWLAMGFLASKYISVSPLMALSSGDSITSWATSDPSTPFTITVNTDSVIFGVGNIACYVMSFDSSLAVTCLRSGSSVSEVSTGSIDVFGTTVYYWKTTAWSYSSSYHYGFPLFRNTNITTPKFYAGYYTAVNGSGSGGGSLNYGNVTDVSFATDIAGSGDASGQNLDKIQWNNSIDSLGNDLPEGSTVTIRAVPGQYTGTSKENLLTKLYTDFVLDTAHATDLATVDASAGWYQETWQSVVSHFTWPFATVLSCLQGESYWYKNGWVYQIRLNVDDYHSEWQTIYNVTSAGVENSETIINSTSITAVSQTVNSINNINQTTNNNYVSNSNETVNNVTNNYYYYGSPVNPNQSGTDVSGLFPSISEILNAIRNLPHTIGELLHNLFDDLFEIDWEYDDFEQQKQYVINNSGAFGQCIGHLDDLKTLIMSYNTASGIALIQWGDIVIDETVIIPAGVFNLGSIVAEDPMRSFYTLYQSLFSGFLYTLTFIKLYREALRALRQ